MSRAMSPARVKRLERKLVKLYSKPGKAFRLRVLGETRRARARRWWARRVMRVKCQYWWWSGRVAGLLARFK